MIKPSAFEPSGLELDLGSRKADLEQAKGERHFVLCDEIPPGEIFFCKLSRSRLVGHRVAGSWWRCGYPSQILPCSRVTTYDVVLCALLRRRDLLFPRDLLALRDVLCSFSRDARSRR